MDHVSVASSCTDGLSALRTLETAINKLVRTCRDARVDSDKVSREVQSLRTVLELIQEDADNDALSFPPNIVEHIGSVVANCNKITKEARGSIRKHIDGSTNGKVAWASVGQEDMGKLWYSLKTHKSALELVLDLPSLQLTKEAKRDTTTIVHDATAISTKMRQGLQEIARLQVHIHQDAQSETTKNLLQKYLAEMTTHINMNLESMGLSTMAENALLEIELHRNGSEVSIGMNEDGGGQVLDSSLVRPQDDSAKAPDEGEADMADEANHNSFHSNDKDSESGLWPTGASNFASITPTYDPSLCSRRSGSSRFDTFDWQKSSELMSRPITPTSVSHSSLQSVGSARQQTRVHHRRVRSWKGNLVLDCTIPPEVSTKVRQSGHEFTHCRYTVVTCPPRQMLQNQYCLRGDLFSKPRPTYILLYFSINSNDSAQRFAKNWALLGRKFAHLASSVREAGEDGWQRWKHILVHIHLNCCIDDLNPLLLCLLGQLGIMRPVHTNIDALDEKILDPPYTEKSDSILGRPVHGTIYEYSSQLQFDHQSQNTFTDLPIQVVFTAPSRQLANMTQEWRLAIANVSGAQCKIDISHWYRSNNNLLPETMLSDAWEALSSGELDTSQFYTPITLQKHLRKESIKHTSKPMENILRPYITKRLTRLWTGNSE